MLGIAGGGTWVGDRTLATDRDQQQGQTTATTAVIIDFLASKATFELLFTAQLKHGRAPYSFCGILGRSR